MASKSRSALARNGGMTWHEQHVAATTLGGRSADRFAAVVGSWTFIIAQTIIVCIWVLVNIFAYVSQWDPYPFILLNLLFSVQAAYAGPIIMMAQNRQADRDRVQAAEDYRTNVEAKKEIESLQRALARIEREKLDAILAALRDRASVS